MRPDGTRVKDLPPLVAAIPYIMPKRYDAWNSVTENIDEEVIKDFIRTHRRAGVRLNHMSVIISAYYKAVLRNPKLNYFVMNGRIYRRNHFCVSFVILKKQADGVVNETTLKVYLDENDTVFTVNQKIKDAIDANKAEHQTNSTDKFAKFMFSVPGLPKFVVWLAYHLDKHGLLPRKIIDLSPFHTSMFITNLASIKTSYIHHHCYEFGTTSVFVCMGKPVPNYISGDLTKKMMPIGVVMDERICTGYEYAAFCNDFRRYMPPAPDAGVSLLPGGARQGTVSGDRCRVKKIIPGKLCFPGMIFALYSQVSGAAARRNRARASRSALPPGLRRRAIRSSSRASSAGGRASSGSRSSSAALRRT